MTRWPYLRRSWSEWFKETVYDNYYTKKDIDVGF